jgi:hypothetical protein
MELQSGSKEFCFADDVDAAPALVGNMALLLLLLLLGGALPTATGGAVPMTTRSRTSSDTISIEFMLLSEYVQPHAGLMSGWSLPACTRIKSADMRAQSKILV